ncbi:MAG: hypothetical protein JWN25_3287 [Verrucomicrobiales bacterium]|nr:hypothetical protein [Verrucomicrobiales bacterium]
MEVTRKPQISKTAGGTSAEATTGGRKLKWKEAQELEKMEASVENAENLVAKLEASIQSPELFKDHKKRVEIAEALEAAKKNKDRLYARWEELEKIKGGA